MKALFFLVLLICTGTPNDKLLDFDRLHDISVEDSPKIDTRFFPDDLEYLWDLSGRAGLRLKIATCTLTHDDFTHDELPDTFGYQHVVAVAIKSDGRIIEDKVALPCPPHCSGGGGQLAATPVTFAGFMAVH